MFEAFLANTSTQGLSPLGTAPQRSFELISGTVRNELGDRHATLFAEPVATQYGDRFDWYASASGKPKRYAELDTEDQAKVDENLEGLISDISTLGNGLLESSDPDRQRLGEALCNAVKYPGTDCIYVLEGEDEIQPVLLNWAWESDNQNAVSGDLSGAEGAARKLKKANAKQAELRRTAAANAPPVKHTPTAATGTLNLWWLMWFGWLLLMLLLAAILYLMVEACALRIPGLPNYCPPAGPSVSDVERRTLLLRDQVATLERQIGIADRACQPDQSNLPIPNPRDRTDLLPEFYKEHHREKAELGQSRALGFESYALNRHTFETVGFFASTSSQIWVAEENKLENLKKTDIEAGLNWGASLKIGKGS